MIRLSFECRHAFDAGFTLDASFDVELGLTALLGRSGAGKTTVLHACAGLFPLRAGRITLGDRVLVDTSARRCVPPHARRVGMVFQDARLFPHMSVHRNLVYGRPRFATRDDEFDRTVSVLELGPLLERRPATLSGGEAQRVALARAMLSSPRLLLLDEPINALDERMKDRVIHDVRAVSESFGVPVLFVSHDPFDVKRLARNVIVMDAGRIVGVEPVEQLDDLMFRAVGALPPVNVLRIDDVEDSGDHWSARLGRSCLFIPKSEASPLPPRFVRFLPHDVILARTDTVGLSVRNHVPGKVCEMHSVGDVLFVAVDMGQRLLAEVTHDAARELDLRVGRDVICLIKSRALRPSA